MREEVDDFLIVEATSFKFPCRWSRPRRKRSLEDRNTQYSCSSSEVAVATWYIIAWFHGSSWLLQGKVSEEKLESLALRALLKAGEALELY